jgi:hypothetical protein
MYGCTNCHTYERIAKSTYNTEDFVNTVLPRMATYSSQAFPPLRQVRKVPRNMVTLLGPLAPRIAGKPKASNRSGSAERGLIGKRDRALLLLLGFALAARRSELVALDVADLEIVSGNSNPSALGEPFG